MPEVYALVAPPGTGKTTLARRLQTDMNECGWTADVFSFADPLRAIVMGMFPLSPTDFSQDRKNLPMPRLGGRSPRGTLIALGDSLRSHITDNVFTLAMQNRIAKSTADAVFIDDLRFLGEAHAIRDMGGTIVRLRRAGIQYPTDGHRSESESERITADLVVELDKDTPRDFTGAGGIPQESELVATIVNRIMEVKRG